MKIKTSISEKKPILLHDIILEIVQIARPEKILLLTARFDYLPKEGFLQELPEQEYQDNHYHLLVLATWKEKISMTELRIRISMRLYDRGNPDLHFIDIHEFNHRVKAGDRDLSFLLLNAMLWYDRGKIQLAAPDYSFSHMDL